MARGSTQANQAATSGQQISNTSAGNAQGLYSTLAPELQAEAAHPPGFDPATMAAMNTDAQQSAGGSAAGAVGQGALLGARTRNAGAADAAIGDSVRAAGRQLSQGVLGTQIANAKLKEQQREQARTGLQGLYGTNTGASVNALGQVASNVNANTNAENASWDWTKGLDSITNFVGTGARSYANIANAGK